MEEFKRGRKSRHEQRIRREKVRELLLKGIPTAEISRQLQVGRNTIYSDIAFWEAYYVKLAAKNPQVLNMQMAKIGELFEEIDLIRKEYWAMFRDVQEKIEQHKKDECVWREKVRDLSEKFRSAVEQGDLKTERRLRQELRDLKRPDPLLYHQASLGILKNIVSRIEREAKLLNLFNPRELMNKHYISQETLLEIMHVFKGIINDLIDQEKRGYAYDRLKKVKIKDATLGGATDAELLN